MMFALRNVPLLDAGDHLTSIASRVLIIILAEDVSIAVTLDQVSIPQDVMNAVLAIRNAKIIAPTR
jgi:hypothetical protein